MWQAGGRFAVSGAAKPGTGPELDADGNPILNNDDDDDDDDDQANMSLRPWKRP